LINKATKTVFCCSAFAAALLFSAGVSAAQSAPTGAGGLQASPKLCEFYQKKFDSILDGSPGSIDVVMRNAKQHGCILSGA
jgi:hypothetical protein